MIEPRQVKRGDRVAVLSPSRAVPAIFPAPFELGLQRMRELFGVEPVEYQTTRQWGASPQARARDLMEAFADDSIAAVFSAIGGIDQVRTLRHLDADVIAANPKLYFGYSDNSHFHIYLWNLGIPSMYGAGVMTQLGMQGEMFEMTRSSLQQALFEGGERRLEPASEYNDIGLDWGDPANLERLRQCEPNDGWYWDGSASARGRLWGGCLESMIVMLGSGRYAPADHAMDDVVLYLETAEGIPGPDVVDHVLRAMGERGWLQRVRGLLMGRPKAWEFDKPNNAEQKQAYRAAQREAIVEVVREYNTELPIVQNLDFGHTDPQVLIPNGRPVTIDCLEGSIVVDYGPKH